jgi:hypothetical protein
VQEILDVLGALGNAAGWTVAVVVLGLGVYGLWQGWVVPGYVYRREVARGDAAESSVEAAQKATEQAATATKAATDAALSVASQLATLQSAINRGNRESR